MILLLDTSTPTCFVTLIDGETTVSHEWEAGRTLARGLLGKLDEWTRELGGDVRRISAIGVMKGPGSFTGLRIGLAVANTLADGLGVAIVGETGDHWQERALERLRVGEDERIVMPEYGGEAHITKPRK